MTRILILAAAVLLGASLAGADTIYLRDKDKALDGTAVRNGDKYLIQLTGGGTMEVDVKDVVYILGSGAATGTSQPTSTAPAGSRPADAATNPVSGAPIAGNGSVDLENVTMPETMVFATMRRLATAGGDTFELRKQLENWRAATHDRQRKIGPNWVGPKEFVQHRTAYDELAKEAQTLAAKVRNKPNTKELLGPAFGKMRQAAMAWYDPLIRNFLLGVADYQAGGFLQSYTEFQQCLRDAPFVAAFSQGEASALADLDRAPEALAPACDFLRMKDDVIDAYDLLKRVMAKVPGTEMRNAAYLQAKDLLAQFQDPGAQPSGSTISKSFTWHMPSDKSGRGWTSRDETTLPTPPYDRLVIRQAMAIPVADNMLLVDGATVNDALDIVVRVDNGKYVQGVVKKASGPKVVSPLVLVTVPSCTFTPVGRTDGPEELKDKDATVYAASLFPELGASPRAGRVKVRLQKDVLRLPGALMPGESTSPVVSETGQLVGFVTGRTDVMAENGGDEKVIPLSEISPLLKNLKSTSVSSSSGRLKRSGSPVAMKEKAFMVYGIFGEKFENK